MPTRGDHGCRRLFVVSVLLTRWPLSVEIAWGVESVVVGSFTLVRMAISSVVIYSTVVCLSPLICCAYCSGRFQNAQFPRCKLWNLFLESTMQLRNFWDRLFLKIYLAHWTCWNFHKVSSLIFYSTYLIYKKSLHWQRVGHHARRLSSYLSVGDRLTVLFFKWSLLCY